MAGRDEDAVALLNKLVKEREDVASLNKIAKGRVVSVICFLGLAGLMWILAGVSSVLDLGRQSMVASITPHLIIAAFMVSLGPLWMAHNYFVIGPLVRETQRLRAEFEALRSENRRAEPGAPPGGGGT